MIRRPPRSTRTDTRFPYTTLFRSQGGRCDLISGAIGTVDDDLEPIEPQIGWKTRFYCMDIAAARIFTAASAANILRSGKRNVLPQQCLDFELVLRSEERRGGKECVRTCRDGGLRNM